MKFSKFNLDESLFDDSFEIDSLGSIASEGDFHKYAIDDSDLDDRFDMDPDNHSDKKPLEGPKPGVESGIADTLINLINDEWEAIQGYNNFRDMIASAAKDNIADNSYMLRVIDEISEEENRHVGQLQELLRRVSPNTAAIKAGQEESKEQIAAAKDDSGNVWVNGKLQVEMHEPKVVEEKNENPNQVSELCNLDDVDDGW